MSLYDSDKKVKSVIAAYTQIHTCRECGEIFTELANVGVWACRYHPGPYNYKTQTYECCGEKMQQLSNYNHFAEYTTWKQKTNPRPFSLGCKRCDHRSDYSTVEYKDVEYEKIAQLIPFMKPGLIDRNMSVDKTLLRKEPSF